MAKLSYTEAKGDLICERIEEGLSLRDIEGLDDGVARNTVLDWLRHPALEEFRAKYARARIVQADAMDEKILFVADNCTFETAPADRVKIDAYKWRASKLNPKKYGDKLDLSNNGEAFQPIQIYIPSNNRD